MGERQLAQSLAEAATDLSLHDVTGPVVSEKISMAYVQALSGQYDRAHTLLTTAWDDAMETTARVADSLADTAHDEGNLTIELEARRQSVEKSGTPTRRAALARSLVESNKAYEASLLVAQPERIEERIAYGMAALQQGHTSEALSALSQAKNEALQLELKDASWIAWMAEGLSACGAVTETIEAKTYLANLVPHQSSFELELAELWERAGDPSKSIVHARIALGITPDSITARKQLAHSLHIHGEAEKALPYFERVVLEDESVLGEYCECALAAHQAQLGLEVATSLVERQPDSAHAQTLLAKAHQLQGEINLARSAISKAIELGSEEAEPLLMLAEIQVGAGEIDAAGETLALALQVAPDDGRAHYARAQWLARQERVHEACELSAKAIKLEPHATNWIVDHAELLSKKGDDQEARVFLEEALSQQPKNWRVRENLARSLENTNEIARAILLVEDPPSDISDQSRFHVGRILIKHGVDAEPAYTHKGMNLIKAAQPASDFKSERIFWLGRSNEALGQYPEALEYYETYLAETETDLEPQALEGMLGYSRVAIALKKPEQAIARLQANREKYPTSLALLKLLAEAHLGNGDAKQAFGIAQEALETNPDSIEARKLLGQTAEAVGDIRTAINAEQDVLAHQPESSDGWSRLAQLYAVIKDVDAARTHMAKAIQIDRRDPDKLQSFSAL
ncbi:MAG: tetratricopeptide repeat protein, partial [Anaerolineales bacterium]|nr:tetratricopeptide repeat protein [Anaerolineales bacterium]